MGGRSDGDGEGEGARTRFPCLASLRTLMAAVVTALAVMVVVMVILVLHRPEKIVFTSYGYVQSQEQWWKEVVVNVPSDRNPSDSATSANHEPKVGVPGGAGGSAVEKEAAVHAGLRPLALAGPSAPAAEVTVLLIMFAYNPSDRGKVNCNITSITVADMANNATDMTEITTVVFSPEDPVAFSVRPQSWHRDRRPPVTIKDPNVLYYLYETHSHQTRFKVMTQVNVTYKPLHSGNDKWINATYYCWPIYFVYGPQDIAGGEVLCKTAEQMDSAVSLKPPQALPPAPAPPGGP